MFKKAEKQKNKLRLAICGPSGSGKTYSALRLAKGLGGKVAFIDTENGSASLYADAFDFDVAEITPPYTPDKYVEAIKFAEKEYDVVVVDSLSHAWVGEGGVLDTVNKMPGNTFQNWGKKGTPMHMRLLNAVLYPKKHLIACMRTKQAYEVVDENGKKVPKKLGLAPIQRPDMEYEFDIVFDVQIENHLATADKDRSPLFDGKPPFLVTEETGEQIINWLNSGEIPELSVKDRYKDVLELAKAHASKEAWLDIKKGVLGDKPVPTNNNEVDLLADILTTHLENQTSAPE